MSEVSLKSFYFALFDDGLAFFFTLKLACIGFCIQALQIYLIVIRNYRTLRSPLYKMCKPIRHVDTFEYYFFDPIRVFIVFIIQTFKITLQRNEKDDTFQTFTDQFAFFFFLQKKGYS